MNTVPGAVVQVPSISFLVSTRNRAPVARECVLHLLSSSRSDIQVVARDNGSTDNTFEVLSEIKDPRLHVVAAGENQGTVSFFEIAKQAAGRIVTWLSDEDDFQFEHLDHVLGRFAEQEECNVLLGSLIVGPGAGRVQYVDEVIEDEVRSGITALQFSGCGGVFVRRTALAAATSFRVLTGHDAYTLWNYYPVGFFASRCVGRKLITTSRVVAIQSRFAETTRVWSKDRGTNAAGYPHYYPESVADRLACNLVNLWCASAPISRRLAVGASLVKFFWLQLASYEHPAFLKLLRENYAEDSVQAYVDHIRKQGLGSDEGRFRWALKTMVRLPSKFLQFHREWIRLGVNAVPKIR